MPAKEINVMTPDELGARVKAHIKAGDKEFALGEQHRSKANDHYKSAGIHLITLKQTFQLEPRKARGLWGDYAKKLAGVQQDQADKYIRIAKQETTIEETREDTAKRMKKLRAKSMSRDIDLPSAPSVPAPYSPPEPDPPIHHDPESDSEEEIRVRGFMWRAAESKRYANFDDLSGLEISSQVIEAASAAADAWSALLSKLKGVRNGQEIETQINEALPS